MTVSFIGTENAEISEKAKSELKIILEKILTEVNYFCRFFYCGKNVFSSSCNEVVFSLPEKRLTVHNFVICANEREAYSRTGIKILAESLRAPLDYVPEEYITEKRFQWMIDNSHSVIFYGTNDETVKKALLYAKETGRTIYILAETD